LHFLSLERSADGREKIEERRIETAIDALALGYESKIVFRGIRSSGSTDYDYKDMPVRDGETPEERRLRGQYWLVGRRVRDNKDFFDRAWKLQPVVMAVFGEHLEGVFEKLHAARAAVEVASGMLASGSFCPAGWRLPISDQER
jgi:hypothetical protein